MELEGLFGKDCAKLREFVDFSMSATPRVEEFVVGENTTENILKLNFECQRCGSCCQYQDETCEELIQQDDGKYACEIHDSPNYSLTCFSYPFRLDVLAIEGIGLRYTQRQNQQTGKPLKSGKKDYVWYEFGCVTGALMLVLYPSDQAIGKGKDTLAKRALQIIDKIPNTEMVPIAPPAAFLCSGVVAVTNSQVSGKMFTESECRNSMDHIKSSDFRNFRRICEDVIKKNQPVPQPP